MTIKNILAVEVILERAGFRVEQQSNNTVYSLLFWWVMRKWINLVGTTPAGPFLYWERAICPFSILNGWTPVL